MARLKVLEVIIQPMKEDDSLFTAEDAKEGDEDSWTVSIEYMNSFGVRVKHFEEFPPMGGGIAKMLEITIDKLIKQHEESTHISDNVVVRDEVEKMKPKKIKESERKRQTLDRIEVAERLAKLEPKLICCEDVPSVGIISRIANVEAADLLATQFDLYPATRVAGTCDNCKSEIIYKNSNVWLCKCLIGASS